MKRFFLLLSLYFCFLITHAQDKNSFTTYWKNGLNVENANGDFKIKFGGRLQYDIMFIHQDDSLNAHYEAYNGSEFRRARLYTSGTLFGNTKYKLQVDFAPAKVVIKDAYLCFTKIPVIGNIQAGNFKQPFGLEMHTSSNYITNMERPLANQFDHDRDLGVMLFNQHADKRISWFVGAFMPTEGLGIYKGNRYQITTRVSGIPLYKTEQQYKVLSVDLAYSYHYDDNIEISYKVRPEAHLAPKYLNLTIDALHHNHQGNVGVALVLGPFAFQSEYTMAFLTPSSSSELQHDNYYMDSYYGTVSWFITGENKNFNKSKTTFDRVNPKNNLGKGGAGAFELALRYSSINFNDKDIQVGTLNDITVGLNWYVNPAVRYTINYIHAHVSDLGRANIFQMRFQVAF
jgi:phosphate-selective porin OprO/OprP